MSRELLKESLQSLFEERICQIVREQNYDAVARRLAGRNLVDLLHKDNVVHERHTITDRLSIDIAKSLTAHGLLVQETISGGYMSWRFAESLRSAGFDPRPSFSALEGTWLWTQSSESLWSAVDHTLPTYLVESLRWTRCDAYHRVPVRESLWRHALGSVSSTCHQTSCPPIHSQHKVGRRMFASASSGGWVGWFDADRAEFDLPIAELAQAYIAQGGKYAPPPGSVPTLDRTFRLSPGTSPALIGVWYHVGSSLPLWIIAAWLLEHTRPIFDE